MNYFSKKNSLILIILSSVLLLFGTILVLCSGQFINLAYDILSQKIFHRDFDIQKWLPTMESLFLFPIFIVVSINAVVFPKYENKYKIIILSVVFALLGFSILYASGVASDYHVNSDLASEFILANECNLEKSFLPTGYYYGTELRTLNTELISAPLFWFTKNWTINKTLTTFFCCLILFIVTWKLMETIEIKENWIKFIISFLIFSPFSGQAMYIGTWGNYYLPHVTLCFTYLILFIYLAFKEPKRYKLIYWIFIVFAFICGLSTIRYVLNFVFPVSIVAIYIEVNKKENPKITDFKNFWIKNKIVFLSITSLFACGFGYVFSSTVIQHFYTLSHFNKIQFCPLGTTTLLDLLRTILDTFGYQEGVSVMTPAGFINLIILVGLVISVINTKNLIKSAETPSIQKFVLCFVVFSFFFNTFVYYTVEFYSRYYYSILVLIFLNLAIQLSNKTLTNFKKYILGVSFSIALISSSFLTVQHFINTNENDFREASVKYLTDHDYKFGYALFENANVITFLTDGKIEVGNFDKTEPIPRDFIPHDYYAYDKWLTPRRYYENNKDAGHIFFLLSINEYEHAKDYKALKNGVQVFKDENFIIFDYESHDAFINAFK